MSISLEVVRSDLILRQWKRTPGLARSAYRCVSWPESRPLSEKEVTRLKALLRQHAPSAFEELFPHE